MFVAGSKNAAGRAARGTGVRLATLFGTASATALLLAAAASPAAAAPAPPTPVNITGVASGKNNAGTGVCNFSTLQGVVASTTTITASSSQALYLKGGVCTVTNNGTIIQQNAGFAAVELWSQPNTFINAGLISSVGRGVYSVRSVQNSGTINSERTGILEVENLTNTGIISGYTGISVG